MRFSIHLRFTRSLWYRRHSCDSCQRFSIRSAITHPSHLSVCPSHLQYVLLPSHPSRCPGCTCSNFCSPLSNSISLYRYAHPILIFPAHKGRRPCTISSPSFANVTLPRSDYKYLFLTSPTTSWLPTRATCNLTPSFPSYNPHNAVNHLTSTH